MENIYKPSDFYCTELLDTKKHFSDFSDLVLKTNLGASNIKDNFSAIAGDVKQSTITDLQNICRLFYNSVGQLYVIYKTFLSSISKLTCSREVGPLELPDTILSQHKLHIIPHPVTMVTADNLKTIETREKFKEEPEKYSKYRHQVRQEFETNIMVIS